MTFHGLDMVKPDSPSTNKLLRIGLGLTKVCNLSCVYCFSAAGRERDEELCISDYTTILQQAKSMGAKTVVIVGEGEPFLFSDFRELLYLCNRLNMVPVVFTNGTQIDAGMVDVLYEVGASLIVKVNSLDSDVHDGLVGYPGSHRKVMDVLSTLLLKGFARSEPTRLAIETVIVQDNIKSIEDLWQYCRRNHIFPYFETLRRCGRANRVSNLVVAADILKQTFVRLQQWDDAQYGVQWDAHPPYIAFSCQQHYFSCFVRANGDVTPCSGIPIVVGNVLHQSLQEILNKPLFVRLRSMQSHIQGRCSRCEYRERCYGCRANALADKGNLFGEDPDCWVRI
jgi:radical SAM protein with 4Fe4S-binding SPASM domain